MIFSPAARIIAFYHCRNEAVQRVSCTVIMEGRQSFFIFFFTLFVRAFCFDLVKTRDIGT